MGQFYSSAGTSPDLNCLQRWPPGSQIGGFSSPLALPSTEQNDEGLLDFVDFTFSLPDECLASIFRFLNSGDRKICSLVCKRWFQVEGQSRHRLSLNAQDEILPFLPSLFTRFDSVKKLSLRCNRKISRINDDALSLVSIRCRNLTRIKLSGRFQLTDMGIAAFASNCKTLKKFSCSSCTLGGNSINALLKHCSTLEELSLKGLRGVIAGNEPIVPGAAAASLRSILLKDLADGLSLIPLIMGSKNLKALKIIRCQGNWDDLFQLFGNGNAMASLTEVHIERIQVSDCGVSAISNCLDLEILHLIEVWDCSNFGLARIAEHCKKIRKLHIDGWRINRIGDEGLMAIAKQCLDLQELVLIGVNPTCLSLSLLASNCVNLERLALCGSRVGDEEIACIAAKCKSLKKLCIKGCPISNIGIESLAWGCPNLAKIKVKKCKGVTGEIKEWLVEKRTSLSVNWDVEEIDHLDASSSDAGSAREVAILEPRPMETGVEAPVAGDGRLTILKTTLGLLAGRSLMACTFGRWSNTTPDSSSSI